MSDVIKFRGKTSQNIIVVTVDSIDTLILKEHTDTEKDLSNLFEGKTITCDIDFTGIKVNTMRECFKDATLTHNSFDTLSFKDAGDLTNMVTGSNLLHNDYLGHPLYMVQFKDELVYFYKEFAGTYFDLVQYFKDIPKSEIDEAILDIRINNVKE